MCVCVCAGKSSVFQAILQNMILSKGSMKVCGQPRLRSTHQRVPVPQAVRRLRAQCLPGIIRPWCCSVQTCMYVCVCV